MQSLEVKKRGIVDFFLKKGLLLNAELLNSLEDSTNLEEFIRLLEGNDKEIAVLSETTKFFVDHNNSLNWTELDKIRAKSEKSGNNRESILTNILPNNSYTYKESGMEETTVKVIFSYNKTPKKREANHFIQYFNSRYQALEKILKGRQELQNSISISRIVAKEDRKQVCIIGMVKDKQPTKSGNYILVVEDMTGEIRVIINRNKPDLFAEARNIMLDEVIGVVGVNGDKVIFASDIIYPSIPFTENTKKSESEAYALFLSDLHVGSNNFLEEEFNKFLRWINCDLGNEMQRDISSKVKYLFIIGDLVDGCGVYPGQEKELKIKDIKEQYKVCAELLSKIPTNIKLVISPGNHDAMRLAEPQLPIYKDFAEPLYNLPNAIMVSNPAMVNIHSSESFEGFNVLIYHGYSFDFYVAEVESIRNKGGYDRADLLMKFLLQKRHLAPSYTSTQYVPDINEDCLVIDKVPDFFVSGHLHKAAASNYKNITLICGSCWQSKTKFQEKVGHNPEPSRVPIVNLKTRQIKILKFGR